MSLLIMSGRTRFILVNLTVFCYTEKATKSKEVEGMMEQWEALRQECLGCRRCRPGADPDAAWCSA